MADDALIEKEMMGEILPFFVYRFADKEGGKEVVGLTVKGVNEVVRRLGKNPKSGSKIRINPQYIVKEEKEYDGQKGIEVSVFAEDLVTGNSAWGVKFEPYRKMGRNGEYANTFAIEKAVSKAERNAKRKLIPETLAIKMIDALIRENPKSVKQIEAPKFVSRVVTPEKPNPTTPEELKAITLNAIMKARTADTIIDIDKRSQASDKLTKEMKAEIHSFASQRVDLLGRK